MHGKPDVVEWEQFKQTPEITNAWKKIIPEISSGWKVHTFHTTERDLNMISLKRNSSKAVFNFWIDVLALPTFLISTISGLALMCSPGAHGPPTISVEGVENKDILFWGLPCFEWYRLHVIYSLIFVGLIVVHLVMHKRWISSMHRRFMTD